MRIIEYIEKQMKPIWNSKSIDADTADAAADRTVSELRKKYLGHEIDEAYTAVMGKLDTSSIVEPYPSPSSILRNAGGTVPGVRPASFPSLRTKKAVTKIKNGSGSSHRKGGVKKKSQMRHGGAYKGRKHSYAAGGTVKDMKITK